MIVVAERSYRAYGRVQQVMFRQTVIRAMAKRNLVGGATNRKDGSAAVDITIAVVMSEESEQDEEVKDDTIIIQGFVDLLKRTKPLNNWGARVDSIVPLPTIIPYKKHQATTDNVDAFNWNPDVEMYI
jgi:acylphosphatase